MELHRQGQFPIERLCKTYSVNDLDKALEDLHKGSVSEDAFHYVKSSHLHLEGRKTSDQILKASFGRPS